MSGRELRIGLASAALVVLIALMAFQLGTLEGYSERRARHHAQYDREEWNNQWLGVEIMQYPTDLMLYQQILTEVRPDLIVETGTASGGLTLYLSNLLDLLNPDGKIITVDIDSSHWDKTLAAIKDAPAHRLLKRIEFIKGSSTAPEVVERITSEAKGKKVLVLLDSLHLKDHVLQELKLYAPLVPVGSYLIVNDTHLDNTPVIGYREGPRAGLEEFLKTDSHFSVDHARTRYAITCAPGGFLKRTQ